VDIEQTHISVIDCFQSFLIVTHITITGTTKRFEVAYQLDKAKKSMTLTGNQTINFSDFNLQPPKKMGKLLKAKDALKIALCLKMESIVVYKELLNSSIQTVQIC
jgi:hypothetical protein